MRLILLAATAAAAIAVPAAPAAARDGAAYFGIEGGVLLPRNSDVDRRGFIVTNAEWEPWIDVDHQAGFDVDVIGGYDFGMFRVEGELAYKRSSHNDYSVDADAPGPFPTGVTAGASFDGDGRTTVTSAMLNGLLDLGGDGVFGFYGGGGFGIARVNMRIDALGTTEYRIRETDRLAWQLIAGVRAPISDNIDTGLKYRYFSAGDLVDKDVSGFQARTNFKSHSLLASLIFNFGAPVAAPPPPPPPVEAPPPPPPPPATQTCPDGTVIPATEVCPAPPPPPPPPPSGERG